jgi:hypothetical protein
MATPARNSREKAETRRSSGFICGLMFGFMLILSKRGEGNGWEFSEALDSSPPIDVPSP